MLGFSAAGALVPRSLTPASVVALNNKVDGPAVPFRIRPQARAIARRGGAA